MLLIAYSVKYLLILFEVYDTCSELHSFANVIKYFEKSGPPRQRGQPWLSLINCFPSNTWTEIEVVV